MPRRPGRLPKISGPQGLKPHLLKTFKLSRDRALLNLVERWFREITDKRLRRASFANIPALIKAITDYLDNHNQNPKVLVWSAPVERIMAKIAKCKEALDALH